MNIPHGRGWEYVGHGERITEIPIAMRANRALERIEREQFWQLVARHPYEKPVDPCGGWWEFAVRQRRQTLRY